MSKFSSDQPVGDMTIQNTMEPLAEVTIVTPLADNGIVEVQTLTLPATSGATQGDYCVIENAAGDDVAFWIDIDADGTAPSGAIYVASSDQGEVDIVTGGTAAQNAALFKTAIDAKSMDITVVDNTDGTLTLTQDLLGPTTDIVVKDEDDSGAGSIVGATGTEGVASALQDTAFNFKSGADAAFYAWYNNNSEGTDPSLTGTGIEVTLTATAMTAAQVLAATVTAIDDNANFECVEQPAGSLTITCAATGVATDATDEDSGFTFAIKRQGSAGYLYAAGSPADFSNEPSVISASS